MRMILIIVLVFLLFIAACYSQSTDELEQGAETWCFEDRCFRLTVADSAAERQEGLMFRASLAEDEGMLFVFENRGKHSFWMKNTSIPLDIIWLDENMHVVDLASADPCVDELCQVYTPQGEAQYVIELNKGTTTLLNLSSGDYWVNE